MKKFSLGKTIHEELITWKSITIIVILGFFYALFSASALNYRLALGTLIGDFPLQYKTSIFINLLFGTWTTMTTFDFFIFLINTVLVGVNIFLIGKTFFILESSKKVRLSVGGATIISLVTTGCASCGLSLLSVLGLSASLSFLPFHGLELHFAALLLLILSAIYMLKQLWNARYCKI